MDWIYLSPHLDDVALSVGGLLWEQSQAGENVAVWTVCAGEPPPGDFSPFAESLHARWETGDQSMPVRRAEDVVSCQRMGADYRHFQIPDCIYRRSLKTGEHLYANEESLWSPVHSDEQGLIDQLANQLENLLPPQAKVVSPLTLGHHVDHHLTRAAAEKLGIPLWYYADYPYVLKTEIFQKPEDFSSTQTPISPAGLLAWQAAIAAHRSQVSTFWASDREMRQAIQNFYQKMGGTRLFGRQTT